MARGTFLALVVGGIVIVLLGGLALAAMANGMKEARLDEQLRAAEGEVKRLEYVLQAAAAVDDARERLAGQLRERGVAPTTEAPGTEMRTRSARPCPPLVSMDAGPSGLLPWQVSRRVAVKTLAISRLEERIACGITVEKRLPALEREVAALEAQLRQLEAPASAP